MSTATELLKRGRKDQIWTKYCGFLDLNLDEFMEIQERLLMEQIALIHDSVIGKEFLKKVPKNVDEFRSTVPITSYEDYGKYFDVQSEDVLPQDAFLWTHTSGRSGKFKWIPYTKQAYLRLGERALTGSSWRLPVIKVMSAWRIGIRLSITPHLDPISVV